MRNVAHPRLVDAPSVVPDFDDHILTWRRAWRAIVAITGFPVALRSGSDFDPPLIHCIADDMEQGLEQHVRYRPVRFGVFALNHEDRRLCEFNRKLAYDPLEPLEDHAKRDHAQVQHRRLQAPEKPIQFARSSFSMGASALPVSSDFAIRRDCVLGDNQFGGQRDQRIHAPGIDAQRPRAVIGASLGSAR